MQPAQNEGTLSVNQLIHVWDASHYTTWCHTVPNMLMSFAQEPEQLCEAAQA